MIQTGLKGKVALITGGNHGIGAATARALAAEGVAVLINYLHLPPLGLSNEQRGEIEQATAPGIAYYNKKRATTVDEVLNAIRRQGGRAEAIEADLSDPQAISMLFEQAEAMF